MTTIDAQVAASHEAAGVAQQEDGSSTVIFRAAQLAQHVLLGPLGLALRESLEQLLDHLGDDVTGGECVDADAILAPFRGEVASKLDHSGLGGIVDPKR
jgi:hypothetical protein